MEGDCFFYEIRFHGLNFPSDGPVMQKKIVKWEPLTEKMYVADEVCRRVMLIWLCCLDAAAITDVTWKVLTSKFLCLRDLATQNKT